MISPFSLLHFCSDKKGKLLYIKETRDREENKFYKDRDRDYILRKRILEDSSLNNRFDGFRQIEIGIAFL